MSPVAEMTDEFPCGMMRSLLFGQVCEHPCHVQAVGLHPRGSTAQRSRADPRGTH